MRIKKIAATAVLTTAVLGVTGGTAAGSPPAASTDVMTSVPNRVNGVDHGIGYTIDRDGKTLTAALTGGTFTITEDTIDVTAADGAPVASLPRRLMFGDQLLILTPRTAANRTKLVATAAAQDIGYWRQSSPRERSMQSGMAVGAMVGSLVGGFIGIVIGIATGLLLLPITLVAGMAVGALGGLALGGAVGAAIPNSDTPDEWHYVEDCGGFDDRGPC
jgi:hypothetical protein